METEERVFLLYDFKGDEDLLCAVIADSPEDVAQALGGQYNVSDDPVAFLWVGGMEVLGTIIIPKELFRPSEFYPEEFLDYENGPLQFSMDSSEPEGRLEIRTIGLMRVNHEQKEASL